VSKQPSKPSKPTNQPTNQPTNPAVQPTNQPTWWCNQPDMPKKSSKPRKKKRKKPAVFRRACFDKVEASGGWRPCYVCVGGQFAGLGAVGFHFTRATAPEAFHRPGKKVLMCATYIMGCTKLPYCVVNRFGFLASTSGISTSLVVGHKTYDCVLECARLRAEVSVCECELLDHQYEKRVVINLVDNPDFKPTKPTGLEGILGL